MVSRARACRQGLRWAHTGQRLHQRRRVQETIHDPKSARRAGFSATLIKVDATNTDKHRRTCGVWRASRITAQIFFFPFSLFYLFIGMLGCAVQFAVMADFLLLFISILSIFKGRKCAHLPFNLPGQGRNFNESIFEWARCRHKLQLQKGSINNTKNGQQPCAGDIQNKFAHKGSNTTLHRRYHIACKTANAGIQCVAWNKRGRGCAHALHVYSSTHRNKGSQILFIAHANCNTYQCIWSHTLCYCRRAWYICCCRLCHSICQSTGP